MKIVISTFLRTLRERDEFDALLPDLLMSMGIVPLSKPLTGTRQYGVDLSAVGKDSDGKEKLFLFVLKKGDIDRSMWSAGPQSVRPTLEEIIDVYVKSHVPPLYSKHPIKIVLSTTGDLKESVQANWAGFAANHKETAEFVFWGADDVAKLLDEHMLDEHLFKDEDRLDLRRTLALIGIEDYDQNDFHRLLLRQLGLRSDGSLDGKAWTLKSLKKAIVRINLATRLVAGWSISNGDTKSALLACERSLLWVWHRIQSLSPKNRSMAHSEFSSLIETYASFANSYVQKLSEHCRVKDGLSGYAADSAVLSLTVFEHIGLLSSVGLLVAYSDDWINEGARVPSLDRIVTDLCALLENNSVSGSPRLDENSIDIVLALTFLHLVGEDDAAKKWLRLLVQRVDFSFKRKRSFPVGTDSIDDLVELEFGSPDEEQVEEWMQMSWMLPSLAGWLAIYGTSESYRVLRESQLDDGYPNVCSQLWHPVSDLFQHHYFCPAARVSGETEAPIKFEEDIEAYKGKMRLIVASPRHDVVTISPAYGQNLYGLDLLACRHFRTPVAPSFWYQFLEPSTEIAIVDTTA